jgi:ZIP family zinc transporter
MIDLIPNLHPVVQALLATCFTWALTALGAATVFITRDMSRKVLDGMIGFAVMMVLDVALGWESKES